MTKKGEQAMDSNDDRIDGKMEGAKSSTQHIMTAYCARQNKSANWRAERHQCTNKSQHGHLSPRSVPTTLTDALSPKFDGLSDYEQPRQDDRSDHQRILPPFIEHHG